MSADFEIMLSSENSQYMAWQTLVFCHSALLNLNRMPTVIVHQTGEPLRDEFAFLAEIGVKLVLAKSYKEIKDIQYPPRNEPGSLLTIATQNLVSSNYFLFCEPDMIFCRCPKYELTFSGEFYRYLDYREPRVQRVIKSYGIENRTDFLNDQRKIGVPYLIPTAVVGQLSSRWMEVLDRFDTYGWIDIMYAFGIATVLDSLDPVVTHAMDHNFDPNAPSMRDLIHYCYGNSNWDKRMFIKSGPWDDSDTILTNAPTIHSEILRQISETRKWLNRKITAHAPVVRTTLDSSWTLERP
jgi:hypothetical protein